LAFNDILHRLFEIATSIVVVVLCLDGFPPAPDCSVNFLLEGSLKPSHLPLLAGREIAGVWLWEWRGELKLSLLCLNKQLLLLLK
jgi:hypothetical protein